MFSRCMMALVSVVMMLAAALANAQPVRTDAGRETGELVGRYSLRDDDGVSQLELRGDGSFEWSFSGGAVERYAKGTWTRESDHLVLEADPLALPPSVFRQPFWREWRAEAEWRLLDGERLQEIERVRARCPFLAPSEDRHAPLIAAASASGTEEADAGPGIDAGEAVRVARSRLLEATRDFEEAAREAVALQAGQVGAGDGEQAVEAMRRAREMKARYDQAKIDADHVRSLAGVWRGRMPEAVLPAGCRYPPEVGQDPPRAAWVGGYAVMIGDPGSGLVLRNVKVTFEFDDGSRAEAVTDGDGWAAVRLPPVARLHRIALQLPYGAHEPESFEVAPVQGVVFDFKVDAMRLAPAFRWMDLRVDHLELVPIEPDEAARGHYQRI